MSYEDKDLIAQARAYADEVWEDVVQDIDFLVQVQSVEDKPHASAGKPFGPGPREALDRALQIANRLGLECHDCDGYVGYADLEGKSKAYIATIAHSDIVPLGDGWTVEPLRVTRKDGYLLGRGVLDDKGPLVLSLYAAHFFVRKLREDAEKLPYTLRCIVGTNEETGMEDVEYYLKSFPEPVFCFTPDAVFPLICGEKGRFFAEVSSPTVRGDDARIVELEGGTVANAVPGSAQAIVRASLASLAPCEGIQIEPAGSDAKSELVKIRAIGKGGHASMPEGTTNAIGLLVEYLVDKSLCNDEERAFLAFVQTLMADTAGEALGIAAQDDVFDPLTCVGGTLRTKRDGGLVRFVQTMDVRYPKSTSGDNILAQITRVAKRNGCSVDKSDNMHPFYMDPESSEVQTLLGTYNQMTGRNDRAITIGGGTYARHFARAVAFGPDNMDEDKPSWVGMEHGPDEGVSEQSLKQALAIYIVSLARLMRLSPLPCK